MIFLWVFFFCLFVLSYASLFLLILSLFLEIYLFSSNRKECGFRWEEKWWDSGRSWRRESYNQNVLYEKYLFSIKE